MLAASGVLWLSNTSLQSWADLTMLRKRLWVKMHWQHLW